MQTNISPKPSKIQRKDRGSSKTPLAKLQLGAKYALSPKSAYLASKASVAKDLEQRRLAELVMFESRARLKGFTCIAGVDEAGRGPLAGPVAAAACIIEANVFFEGINDSKLLSPQKRKILFDALKSHPGVCYGIGRAEVEEIDHLNILQATLLAMKRALDALSIRPDYLLADAVMLNYCDLPNEKIIKGDQKSQSIAAASILAKETRDQWMEEYHLLYPMYGFNQHKGYGTEKHLEAIRHLGPCPIHRRSFEPVKNYFNGLL